MASDDIYGWFSEIFEESDEPGSIVYVDELFSRFANSNMYTIMSKAEKQKHTQKDFLATVTKNVFLQHYLKKRGSRYNSTQLTNPAIIGFKPKVVSKDPPNDI